MPQRSVICFGEALWDILPNERVPGGAPMNVALRLERFGVDVKFLSRVGRDDDGEGLLEFMRARSLSTDFVQRDEERPTGTVLVDTSDPSAVSYSITENVAWDYIDADEFGRLYDGPPDVLVYGSLAARHAASRASLLTLLNEATLCVLDVNLRPPYDEPSILERLLDEADWVKVNEHELALLTNASYRADEAERMAMKLRDRFELDVVCVTMGADGALLLADGKVYRQPAFAVDVVDTVGCGDAFLGSWLAAMLEQQTPQAALERAAAVAAIVAGSEGANPSFTDRDVAALIGGR